MRYIGGVDRGSDGASAKHSEERPGPEGQPGHKKSEGFSQFLAKELDQLSISAWLPAAMLTGCSTVLVQLHAQQNSDVPSRKSCRSWTSQLPDHRHALCRCSSQALGGAEQVS